MDMGAIVTGLSKLADYAASGIGSVVGPMLAVWKAQREAEAKLIAAKGEAEEQQILAEGQATTMQIIARAQANARSILVSPDSAVQGQLEFGSAVTQRIQFQEEKRQNNIGQVVTKTALKLEGKDVEDHEPDHDWTARFFNDVQDVSSDEMQLLWAKVLAGEIERPGSVSIRALSILRNLDQAGAKLFQVLCSACVTITAGGLHILDARVPSLGGNAGANSLQAFGLPFDNLNILNEHGLIISDYNSWFDMRLVIGFPEGGSDRIIRIPFRFQERYWVLTPSAQRTTSAEFKVHGVALTQAGKELSKIIECETMPGYQQALANFFASQSLIMTEVKAGGTHVGPLPD